MSELGIFQSVLSNRLEVVSGTVVSPIKAELYDGSVVKFSGLVSVSDVGKRCTLLKNEGMYTLMSINSSLSGKVKTIYV